MCGSTRALTAVTSSALSPSVIAGRQQQHPLLMQCISTRRGTVLSTKQSSSNDVEAARQRLSSSCVISSLSVHCGRCPWPVAIILCPLPAAANALKLAASHYNLTILSTLL